MLPFMICCYDMLIPGKRVQHLALQTFAALHLLLKNHHGGHLPPFLALIYAKTNCHLNYPNTNSAVIVPQNR